MSKYITPVPFYIHEWSMSFFSHGKSQVPLMLELSTGVLNKWLENSFGCLITCAFWVPSLHLLGQLRISKKRVGAAVAPFMWSSALDTALTLMRSPTPPTNHWQKLSRQCSNTSAEGRREGGSGMGARVVSLHLPAWEGLGTDQKRERERMEQQCFLPFNG